MLVPICTKCNARLAISPEGLCNECDSAALHKRSAQILAEVSTNTCRGKTRRK